MTLIVCNTSRVPTIKHKTYFFIFLPVIGSTTISYTTPSAPTILSPIKT